MGKAAIAAAIVIVILVIVGGLFYYSYTQIQVSLNDIKFHSIQWETLTWTKLLQLGLNALSGDWLSAAFNLINGINLNLIFGLSNNGFLPVYIPDLSYDLLVNGVSVGRGFTSLDLTIFPGETKSLPILQNFKKSSLSPAVQSIVARGGIMDVRISGTAYFNLFGLSIPVPFESSKQISIIDEVRNRLNTVIEENKPKDTRISLSVSDNSVYEGTNVSISGRLTLSDGRGVPNAIVYIKDEDSLGIDDTVANLRTDSSGYFSYTWRAETMDPLDNVVEIYAVFNGASNYESSRSNQYDVYVQEQSFTQSQPSSQSPPSSTPQNTFKQTSLSLNIPKTSVSKGEGVAISGMLLDSNGKGVQGASIYIKDDDTFGIDDVIFILTTNSNGFYSVLWSASTMDPLDNVVEIYAVFEGSSNYGKSRSNEIDVRVN